MDTGPMAWIGFDLADEEDDFWFVFEGAEFREVP